MMPNAVEGRGEGRRGWGRHVPKINSKLNWASRKRLNEILRRHVPRRRLLMSSGSAPNTRSAKSTKEANGRDSLKRRIRLLQRAFHSKSQTTRASLELSLNEARRNRQFSSKSVYSSQTFERMEAQAIRASVRSECR